MPKFEVQVKNVPVRYEGVTYPSGAVFIVAGEHLKSMEHVTTVKKEIDENVDKPIDDMKLEELKDYAQLNDIHLGEATKKDDILAAIKAASKREE